MLACTGCVQLSVTSLLWDNNNRHTGMHACHTSDHVEDWRQTCSHSHFGITYTFVWLVDGVEIDPYQIWNELEYRCKQIVVLVSGDGTVVQPLEKLLWRERIINMFTQRAFLMCLNPSKHQGLNKQWQNDVVNVSNWFGWWVWWGILNETGMTKYKWKECQNINIEATKGTQNLYTWPQCTALCTLSSHAQSTHTCMHDWSGVQ